VLFRSLRGVYRAIDFFNKDHAKAVEIMAPHFKLDAATYEDVLKNLTYTSYEEAVEFMGTGGKRGKLHDVFDEIMGLNLENGAADTKLDSNQQIDNSIVTGLFDGHKR